MINQSGKEEVAFFRRYLVPAEQRKLLEAVGQYAGEVAQRDGAVIRLLRASGMRIGETLSLSVGDAAAAMTKNYLFVPKEHRKGESGDLSVFVTKSVREALKDLLALRDGAELDEALIVSRKSAGLGWRAMTVRGFEQRFAHWAQLAGLPAGASPHWLRHTHAKNIIRNSQAADPIRVAQIALGQRSRRSTEIYTRLDREEFETALQQVDGTVNAKPRLRLADLRREYEGRAA